MHENSPLSIKSLLRHNLITISLTWVLTFIETVLLALIPLFIGYSIDGVLADDMGPLWNLVGILLALIFISVARRVYDTRVYGTIRVGLESELISRSKDIDISTLTARLGMSRELVDFLEIEVPPILTSIVQFTITIGILFTFHLYLAGAALLATIVMLGVYGASHERFQRLYGDINKEMEKRVTILDKRESGNIITHLRALRTSEVCVSDTEAIVYGLIFTFLLGVVVFNLWFSTAVMTLTVGTIFAIVTYSWDFVNSAFVMPVSLQKWSKLSDITQRINAEYDR